MTALLERESLLARLGDAVGAGRLVFLGGEAGVGKTSLVRAFVAGLGERVLEGSCENLATPTPFGPLLDLGVDLDPEPRRVAGNVLEALARTRTLVLEDVHWADQATLDVLRVIGRRIEGTRALVVATYRDDEVDDDHPLRVVLGELASARGVERTAVPRLSLRAVETLASPSGVDAEAVYRLTQGNAFYVTEILAAGGDELPESVRDAVLARVARLAPDARRLLDVVAVVPARSEIALLEAVAAAELNHLDECLSSGVLRAEGDAVAFRHELARLAVESTIGPHRRRALHAAILAALAPSGDPSRLAHHADGAGDSDAVLRHSVAAGAQAAAASAHREAAAHYARALRHADALSPEERVRLVLDFGQEAEVIGRYEDAITARLEAIELFRLLGDRLGEAATLSHLTIPYIRAGRNAEAEESSLEAIALLEALPPGRELAAAYADQAYARMLCRDNREGVAWGTKAVSAAIELGDRDTLAFGLNMVGTSYVMAGEIERGISSLLESLEVAREDGLELRVVSALGMLGSGLGEMFELARSEQYLKECIDYAEAHELTSWYTRAWLALVEIYTGRWDDGATRAIEILDDQADTISRITANIALGRVRARRGDPGASSALDDALRDALPGGHLQRLGHIRAARAEAAWLSGDRERTVAEARASYGLALEKRHPWFAGELAYWQWKAGALDAAPEWVAEPYRLQLAGDARAGADAWRDRGCPYEAARALAEAGDDASVAEAIAVFDGLGARPAARLARQVLQARGAPVPRGPRAATRENPAGMTARELEVLRLVAAGLRNGEIAAELVVSRRTVDHHVSAILRKLGIRTRAEAVAEAYRLGVAEAPSVAQPS